MSSFSYSEIDEALALHNQLRKSLNYPPLTYCTTLASHAQDYANSLLAFAPPKLEPAPQDLEGENLFMGPEKMTLVEAVKIWTSSSKNSGSESNTDTDLTVVTGPSGKWIKQQIIHLPVSKIGFGLSRSKQHTFIVARYDVPLYKRWMMRNGGGGGGGGGGDDGNIRGESVRNESI